MDLIERLIFLAVGGGLGFILGYIVRGLRDIKEELDEVMRYEKKREHDEAGMVRMSPVTGIALALVVLLTAFAAFSSQKSSNESNETQDQIVRLVTCNQAYLAKTIKALNERTEYSSSQATANVKLQKSQVAFFSLLLGKPPATAEQRQEAAQKYLNDLTEFVKVSEKQKIAVTNNPYPTTQELAKCLAMPDKES